MTKTLLHTCCAPCSVACIQLLRAEGIEPVSYWYNPNLHPYQEYKARRDTLVAYAPSVGVELIVQEDYGLREFCRAVADDIDHRCGKCYGLRLEQTARYAALRDAGLSVEEALWAACHRMVTRTAPYDNRSHLRASAPLGAAGNPVAMSAGEMQAARDLFSDLTDDEIERLYARCR